MLRAGSPGEEHKVRRAGLTSKIIDSFQSLFVHLLSSHVPSPGHGCVVKEQVSVAVSFATKCTSQSNDHLKPSLQLLGAAPSLPQLPEGISFSSSLQLVKSHYLPEASSPVAYSDFSNPELNRHPKETPRDPNIYPRSHHC